MRSRLRRMLAYVERLPFRFGQYSMVTFDRDHPPIDNRRDPQLPTSDVPRDVQQQAVERLRRQRDESRR